MDEENILNTSFDTLNLKDNLLKGYLFLWL